MAKKSASFIPVFIDTLEDRPATKRFSEFYGSYPVLRIHDLKGQDIAGRLDGNQVAGHIPVAQVLEQLDRGLRAFGTGKR